VAGELRQFRRDVARRVVQVTLRPRVALEVTSVRLRAPGFAPAPPAAVDLALPAGSTVDVPVPYAAADCAALPGTAQAVLQVDASGPGRTLIVPLADRGLLERLHTRECTDRALAATTSLTVAPTWTPSRRDGRPSLRGTLRLVRRAPGERVVVDGLGAHVVFAVRSDPPRTPLGVLAPDQDRLDIPLELVPTRCDAHALAENKRLSLLGVYVALGNGAARLTTVTPDPASRARLEQFAVAGCRS
jgi:hypothetical protein